jgi:hypothetical protein
VTNADANAVDGKDADITKSINMADWQANLTEPTESKSKWKGDDDNDDNKD